MSKNRENIIKIKKYYTKLPNQLFELGSKLNKQDLRIYPYAVTIYGIFVGSAVNYNPSIRDVHSKLKYSKDTISKAMAWLVAKNLIKLVGKDFQGRNTYSITSPDEWQLANKFIYTKDTASKIKDSLSDNIGPDASCNSGHNNEDLTKNKTMNDVEKENTTTSSSSLDHLPEENNSDPLADSQYRSWGGEIHLIDLPEKQIQKIFSNIHKILWSKHFRQNYVKMFDETFMKIMGLYIQKRIVPQIQLDLFIKLLDSELLKRFKKEDPKPWFQFDSAYCQNIRKECIAIVKRWITLMVDFYCNKFELEDMSPMKHLPQIYKYAKALNCLGEEKNKLHDIANKHLGIPYEIMHEHDSFDSLAVQIMNEWKLIDDRFQQSVFYAFIAELERNLRSKIFDLCKPDLPEYADFDIENFFDDNYDIKYIAFQQHAKLKFAVDIL